MLKIERFTREVNKKGSEKDRKKEYTEEWIEEVEMKLTSDTELEEN